MMPAKHSAKMRFRSRSRPTQKKELRNCKLRVTSQGKSLLMILDLTGRKHLTGR